MPRVLLCLVLLVVACHAAPSAPAAASRPAGKGAILDLVCSLADADVFIDDDYLGETGDVAAGVRLAPGVHRVEIRREGYHTRYLEISLVAGETRRLEVALAEALP